MSGSVLSIKNVVKRYSSHVALDDVSIEIPEKSIFGLLGPNGAGKTSLIRIINQITGPDSGSILFDGRPITAKDVEQIGYLPEERGLYKKMAVGEQAMYLAQLKGLKKAEAKQKLKEWFDKFDIAPWWNKKVEELSKGMQQKIQFIVTVLHEPKLLILDEPFSGFDPINANIIKDEILKLKQKGCTILFSTHNMGSVEELCDYIALINKSKKILDGSVKEIRRQFKSDTYEIEFLGNMMAFTDALFIDAELLEHSVDGEHGKARIKPRNNATSNDVLKNVLSAVKVVSFKEIIPSMNDIFIAKVNGENALGTKSNYTE